MNDGYTVLPTASSTLVYSISKNTVTGELRGINTRAAVVGSHANQYDTLLLIEFHPAGLYPLIKIPQSELLNGSFPFAQFDARLNKEILDSLHATNHIASLKESLDRIFLKHLIGVALNPQLNSAMKIIYETNGSANLSALSKAVYIGERQLERIFKQYIGTGVKTFSRIVRVNHSLRLLKTTNERQSFIAAEAGYHDQAHFIHEFKALCGVTPQSYLNRKSDFYNDVFKM
jgi:AraC-like DNA-binding protein